MPGPSPDPGYAGPNTAIQPITNSAEASTYPSASCAARHLPRGPGRAPVRRCRSPACSLGARPPTGSGPRRTRPGPAARAGRPRSAEMVVSSAGPGSRLPPRSPRCPTAPPREQTTGKDAGRNLCAWPAPRHRLAAAAAAAGTRPPPPPAPARFIAAHPMASGAPSLLPQRPARCMVMPGRLVGNPPLVTGPWPAVTQDGNRKPPRSGPWNCRIPVVTDLRVHPTSLRSHFDCVPAHGRRRNAGEQGAIGAGQRSAPGQRDGAGRNAPESPVCQPRASGLGTALTRRLRLCP